MFINNPLKTFSCLLLGLGLACTQTYAKSLSEFTREFKERFPQAASAKVIEVDSGRLYAAIDAGRVVFVDDKLRFLIDGSVIDLKTNQNLTQKIIEENRPKVDQSKLDVKNAILVKKANPEKAIYVFSDPDCPYCKKLERSFDELTDVTVYIFPLPLDELHPNAANIAMGALCSTNPSTAWTDYTQKGVVPVAVTKTKDSRCEANAKNILAANKAYAKEFGIAGTPAIIFPSGELVPGAIPAAQIMLKINATRN